MAARFPPHPVTKENVMKRSDTKRLQEILEAEAAILRGALRNREGIVIESASEEYERMRLAGQRDLALVFGDRESRRLRDIEAALGRIEKDSFGVCVDCEEQIPAKRLAALPWASRCVSCRETVDYGPERKDSSFHFLAA